MAKRGRKSGHAGADVSGDGLLSFGVSDSDRSLPTRRRHWLWRRRARPRRAAEPQPKPARRRPRRKRGNFIAGITRRLVRASLVLLLVATVGTGVLVAYAASKLPPTAEWTVPQRPPNVRILAADGALITNRGDSVGTSVALHELPDHLPQAVIAIEDRRFYWHFGIDPIGLVRALFANWQAGGVVQGGSTITQQLAKNLFLTPERTFERKIQEVILAFWLEARLTKPQILELYLNRVYLGAGAYGVDAAAHRYFGKSARKLTLAESATLAGLLKAPATYSPVNNPKASEERTGVVLAAMRGAGFVTDAEVLAAHSGEVATVRDVAGGSGRYVADWVMDQLPGFVGALDRDILVETTIDLRLQAAAARAVAETLAEDGDKLGVGQGALVAIDETGAVKALVGGRDYSRSPFNRAVASRRQPGSAFKPFVYLTALESGLIPESIRVDQPVSIGNWRPENYTKEYRGPVSLQTALSLSLNTVSAQLVAEVGPAAVAATARRLGITSPLLATPSIALGTSEVSPLELTAAFVPFSNGGRGVIPRVINRITTAGGDILYERMGSGPGQVIDPMYVAMMNSMLRETIASGTGRRAEIAGWPAAGKTGTSQDFRDAWFIGYTRVLTAGVWFGNDDNKSMNRTTGGTLPAAAWNRFMTEALAGVPVAALPGNYRLHDPDNFEIAATALGDAAGMDAFLQGLGDDGFATDWPGASTGDPMTLGPGDATPERRRPNFFQRLFGGG
jgi:penicillin-binding protein 1A